jgi:multidrug efflux pump subunit AcrB
MEKTTQMDAITALNNWSKWLIGLNTTLGGGCLTILQTGNVQGLTRTFLIAAIITFLLSVLCSILLSRVLASLTEHLPTERSIYYFSDGFGVSVKHLARAQLLTFLLADALMAVWLMLKIG